MSTIWFKRYAEAGSERVKNLLKSNTSTSELEVSDQNPLPASLLFLDGEEYAEADNSHGFPVKLVSSVPLASNLTAYSTTIPGIGTGAAYAASDQFGTLIAITGVPLKGTIAGAWFYDFDNEGLNKELWIFSAPVTLADDNAAFAVSDTDLTSAVDVITFNTWNTATNNQLGIQGDTPLTYDLGTSTLYLAVKTLGVDNIAAGSIPRIKLTIRGDS